MRNSSVMQLRDGALDTPFAFKRRPALVEPAPARLMSRVCQIFVDGRMAKVTDQHVEIAQLIYARRPHIWGGETKPAPWAEAPARVQIEFLELAHAVLAHPIFAGGACQRGAQG